MAFFPNRVIGANRKDESRDVPGNDEIINARDFNSHDEEIRAVEAFIGTAQSTDQATLVGRMSSIVAQVAKLSGQVSSFGIPSYGPDAVVDPVSGGTHTTIHAALTALPVTGGWIHLRPGVHKVHDPVVLYGVSASGKSVLITGSGESTLVEVGKNTTGFLHKLPTTLILADMIIGAVSGSISSIGIDVNEGSGRLAMSNVRVKGMQNGVLIRGVGCSGYLNGCTFDDSTLISVKLDSESSSLAMDGCRIRGQGAGTGISLLEGTLLVSSLHVNNVSVGVIVQSTSNKICIVDLSGVVSSCSACIQLSGVKTFAGLRGIMFDNTINTVQNSTSGSSVVKNDTISGTS
jgi:hypothetical protein